jgi:hypothetical protein
MTENLSGSCLCGAVRIDLHGPPYRVGLCHCLDCRKKTGSLFNAFAVYPAASLRVAGATTGHRLGSDYTLHVCAACASPVYQRQDGSDEAEIFIGMLDEPSRLTPSYELWTVRRERWLPEFDLARHYEHDREGKGRSEP